MSFRLKKDNVERVVNDEAIKDKMLEDGYKLVEEEKKKNNKKQEGAE